MYNKPEQKPTPVTSLQGNTFQGLELKVFSAHLEEWLCLQEEQALKSPGDVCGSVFQPGECVALNKWIILVSTPADDFPKESLEKTPSLSGQHDLEFFFHLLENWIPYKTLRPTQEALSNNRLVLLFHPWARIPLILRHLMIILRHLIVMCLHCSQPWEMHQENWQGLEAFKEPPGMELHFCDY